MVVKLKKTVANHVFPFLYLRNKEIWKKKFMCILIFGFKGFKAFATKKKKKLAKKNWNHKTKWKYEFLLMLLPVLILIVNTCLHASRNDFNAFYDISVKDLFLPLVRSMVFIWNQEFQIIYTHKASHGLCCHKNKHHLYRQRIQICS